MVYPANFESKVGFDRLREQISQLCSMERAREMLGGEQFSSSERVIVERQSLADEVGRLLSVERDFPRDEFADIDAIVAKIRIEGSFLDTAEVVTLVRALRSAGEISSPSPLFSSSKRRTQAATVTAFWELTFRSSEPEREGDMSP